MAELHDRVAQVIERYGLFEPGDRVVVGVSGGPDSLVLLHVLHRLRARLAVDLHAATLDHGIRGAAGAADAAFVRRTATSWGVPVTSGVADVPRLAREHRLSLEEAARQVRYTFLLRVARQLGAARIAVGHNRDDQAETVLMHLIRGSGLSGLRGMLRVTPLSDYHLLDDATIRCTPPLDDPAPWPDAWPVLVRPLLDVPRADIDAYAAAHQLTPRQDMTNIDLTYFRNRLRHEVLPLLEALNPNICETLARTADVLQADADVIRQIGEAILSELVRETVPGVAVVDRTLWRDQPLAIKRFIVRRLVRRLRPEVRDVSFAHVAAAIAVADAGRTGARATLPGGLVLRVGYDSLVIADAGADAAIVDVTVDAPALPDQSADWSFRAGESVRFACGHWEFTARPLASGDDRPALDADPLAAALAVSPGALLVLRTRRPGDRFCPRGMGGHSQKLADTLITMRVPASWRDRVPLLVVDGRVAWFVAPVPGGLKARVSEHAAVPDAPEAARELLIVVQWKRAAEPQHNAP